MKTYELTVPILGHAYVSVEADSEAEAIEKALSNVYIVVKSDKESVYVAEQEGGAVKTVCEGNFFYGAYNSVSVDDEWDDE